MPFHHFCFDHLEININVPAAGCPACRQPLHDFCTKLVRHSFVKGVKQKKWFLPNPAKGEGLLMQDEVRHIHEIILSLVVLIKLVGEY
jgi:hypothetical protein